MAGWDNGVSPPGGASYSAPLLNFANFGNWAKDYQQGVEGQQQQGLNDQQKQLNDAKLQQMQQQIELSKAFAGGLPTDQSTGQIDYRKAAAILASKGDIAGAVNLLQQQPAPLPPIFAGQPGQPQGQPTAQPTSVPARPLPAPAANSPKGDSGTGTITSLVTDKLPAQNQTTGETIMKIAQVMGIDPNADLTPGQQRRAQGLLQKYEPQIAGAGSQGGTLPPSANAVSPAPTPGAAQPAGRTGAPGSGGTGALVPANQPQGGQVAAAPQPSAQAGQPNQPLVPQEPLPPGYTDPMKAIQDLRLGAARLSGDQRKGAAEYSAQMTASADRIEARLKPLSVGASTTLIDPQTGKTLYQGPAAAAYGGAGGETGATLDADAETYRQTGKLPPNMGRGVQGATQATRVRERAAEIEAEAGGDPKDWATRWQNFGAQATGARVLQQRATNLRLAENEASSLIPRVREASDKINRTQYPTLNSLILASEKGSGGEDVVKYGLAVASLIPVYARVLKPTGQITEGDTHRATEILDKAWSKGQIGAALDQMEIEMQSARSALDKTIDEQSGKKKTEAPAKPGSSDAKWTTLPNGVRIREVAQ